MTPPKFNLLYFKNVLERCFLAFAEERQDCFVKNACGQYVFAGDAKKAGLARIFRDLAVCEIRKHVVKFDSTRPEYLFVIGGCDPKDNILLAHRSKRFPAKLDALLKSDRNLKYAFKEKDVLLDSEAFNSAFESAFEELFSSREKFGSLVGGYGNAFMIRHRQLDCYSMFKTLKYILGRQNCVNVYAEKFKDKRQCLIAVNDVIDRYSNKTELNSSLTFKRIVREVRNYVNCLLGLNCK